MKQLRNQRGQTVSVFLDGVTLQGVLWEATADGLELRDAHAVTDGGDADVPGEVHVPAHSIVWVQVVTQ